MFTLRFLWHANRARWPYRIVVADGQVRPELAALLENSRDLFPELDLTYLRYHDDKSFVDFFAKVADALAHVTTPYAVIADNDDFPLLAGVEHSLDYLDSSPDYVCCGGGIAGFSVYAQKDEQPSGLLGPLNRLAFRYAPYDRSIDLGSDSMTERLVQGLRISWSYYAVFRTEALWTVWREVAELNLSDLQLHEKFCAMRTLTLGKARSDGSTIAYLRQYWTSSQFAFVSDWVHHLVRNRFSTDFAAIIAKISTIAATSERLDREVVAEKLRERVEPWLRDFLRLNYGPMGALRDYLRRRIPGLLAWRKERRRYSVPFERRSLIARLRQAGASESYLMTFRAELAQIEDVVGGREFRRFVQPYVAKLTDGPSR